MAEHLSPTTVRSENSLRWIEEEIMLRRIGLMATALAVSLAVAAPAAQAVTLVDGEANPVAPESTVTAVSNNTHTVTGLGKLECGVFGITGVLTENGGEHVTIEKEDPEAWNATGEECSALVGPFTFPTHITTAKVDQITLEEGNVGKAFGFTFDSELTAPTGAIRCHFVETNEFLSLSWTEGGIGIVPGVPTNLKGTEPCGHSNITAATDDGFTLYLEKDGEHVEQLFLIAGP